MKRIAQITTEYHAWATSSADPKSLSAPTPRFSAPPPFSSSTFNLSLYRVDRNFPCLTRGRRERVTRPSTRCFFWPNMFTKLSAGQNPLQPIPDQGCHRAFVVLTCHPKTPHKNGVPPGPGGAELISNLVTSRLRGLALNQKPRRAESHCGSHQASAFIEPGDEL